MKAALVQAKIDALTKDFDASLGVPLWSEPPLMAFSDIACPVTDYDGLKARLASLAALFDHFNKKGFDAALGFSTAGTRAAFIAFLKRSFPDDQPQIEAYIETPIGLMCLLRDYLLHTKNKKYRKALDFFELADPIEDPPIAWDGVLARFAECLDRIRNLITDSNRNRYNNEDLTAEPLEFLVNLTYARHRHLLESSPAAAMINEVIRRGSVTDVELAATFGVAVGDLRNLLHPIIGDILIVRPVDRHTTQLSISGPMIDIMRKSREGAVNED